MPIELRIDYRKMNTFFADYTKNISKGGTFIKTDKPLDVGTRFVFKLELPNQVPTLELRGEVRWVHRPGDEPSADGGTEPGMGIRFVFESDEERIRFEGMVEDLMRDSLGDELCSKLLDRCKA